MLDIINVLALVVNHHFPLEQPLGKIAKMDHEPAEIQRVPVKPLLIEVLHHRNGPFNQVRDVVHFAHVGIQLGIYNMQSNECRLILVKHDSKLILYSLQAMLAQMVLRGIVTHNGTLQGIAELHTVSFAFDGKADMVCQGDQQGFVELLRDLGFDIFDQGFCQSQMLHRDLFHQLPQLPLFCFFLHAVGALDALGIDELTPVPPETNAAAGDDQLVTLLVNDTQNIIIDELLDPHPPRPLSDIKK